MDDKKIKQALRNAKIPNLPSSNDVIQKYESKNEGKSRIVFNYSFAKIFALVVMMVIAIVTIFLVIDIGGEGGIFISPGLSEKEDVKLNFENFYYFYDLDYMESEDGKTFLVINIKNDDLELKEASVFLSWDVAKDGVIYQKNERIILGCNEQRILLSNDSNEEIRNVQVLKIEGAVSVDASKFKKIQKNYGEFNEFFQTIEKLKVLIGNPYTYDYYMYGDVVSHQSWEGYYKNYTFSDRSKMYYKENYYKYEYKNETNQIGDATFEVEDGIQQKDFVVKKVFGKACMMTNTFVLVNGKPEIKVQMYKTFDEAMEELTEYNYLNDFSNFLYVFSPENLKYSNIELNYVKSRDTIEYILKGTLFDFGKISSFLQHSQMFALYLNQHDKKVEIKIEITKDAIKVNSTLVGGKNLRDKYGNTIKSKVNSTVSSKYSFGEFPSTVFPDYLNKDLYSISASTEMADIYEETFVGEDVNQTFFNDTPRSIYMYYFKPGQYCLSSLDGGEYRMQIYDSEEESIWEGPHLANSSYGKYKNCFFIYEEGYYYVKVSKNNNNQKYNFIINMIEDDTYCDFYNPIVLEKENELHSDTNYEVFCFKYNSNTKGFIEFNVTGISIITCVSPNDQITYTYYSGMENKLPYEKGENLYYLYSFMNDYDLTYSERNFKFKCDFFDLTSSGESFDDMLPLREEYYDQMFAVSSGSKVNFKLESQGGMYEFVGKIEDVVSKSLSIDIYNEDGSIFASQIIVYDYKLYLPKGLYRICVSGGSIVFNLKYVFTDVNLNYFYEHSYNGGDLLLEEKYEPAYINEEFGFIVNLNEETAFKLGYKTYGYKEAVDENGNIILNKNIMKFKLPAGKYKFIFEEENQPEFILDLREISIENDEWYDPYNFEKIIISNKISYEGKFDCEIGSTDVGHLMMEIKFDKSVAYYYFVTVVEKECFVYAPAYIENNRIVIFEGGKKIQNDMGMYSLEAGKEYIIALENESVWGQKEKYSYTQMTLVFMID